MTLRCWESKKLKEFLMDKLETRYEGEDRFIQKYADGNSSAMTPTVQKFHKQLGDLIDDLNDTPMCGEGGTGGVERTKTGNIKKEKKQRKNGGKRAMSDYQKHISVCAAPEKHGVQAEKRDFGTCIELWKSGQKMHTDFREKDEPEPEPEE